MLFFGIASKLVINCCCAVMKMLLKHSLTEEALTLAAPRKQWRAPDSWPTALQEEDSTAAPGGCPSFHFSTLFPPPPRHLCSGFWLVVHRCSSCGMQLSCPCIPGSTEFKCSGSHRSLDRSNNSSKKKAVKDMYKDSYCSIMCNGRNLEIT